MEVLTEAPVLGKSGETILLRSLNSSEKGKETEDQIRWAYCWSCSTFVQTIKKNHQAVIRDYVKRPGVSYRAQARGVSGLIAELEEELTRRRTASRGRILPMKKRAKNGN